jgi:dihydrofolate reductase
VSGSSEGAFSQRAKACGQVPVGRIGWAEGCWLPSPFVEAADCDFSRPKTPAVNTKHNGFARKQLLTGSPVPKLRGHSFAVSIDGFGAGPNQDSANPLGVGGAALHEWAFATRTFRKMFGQEGGTTGPYDEFAARGFCNIGAWIMGRNMFGPIRDSWPDESWKGWCGDNPPFHTPVFVLTNHPRASFPLDGGTTFHFVTDGIHDALEQAKHAAGKQDVRLGGGVATIQQYLRVGLIDEMHLAIAPILLGSGEPLLAGIDAPKLGYQCTEQVPTPNATHVVLARRR